MNSHETDTGRDFVVVVGVVVVVGGMVVGGQTGHPDTFAGQ